MIKKQPNQTNSTSIKDLLGMVKDDLQKDLLRIEAKIDLHIQISDKEKIVYNETVTKQTEILKHVCDELPEKGYCAKVDQMYESLYPHEGETLQKKVDILMYDRAMLKYILVTSIGAITLSAASVLLKILWR